jgi:hypothetical protein
MASGIYAVLQIEQDQKATRKGAAADRFRPAVALRVLELRTNTSGGGRVFAETGLFVFLFVFFWLCVTCVSDQNGGPFPKKLQFAPVPFVLPCDPPLSRQSLRSAISPGCQRTRLSRRVCRNQEVA